MLTFAVRLGFFELNICIYIPSEGRAALSFFAYLVFEHFCSFLASKINKQKSNNQMGSQRQNKKICSLVLFYFVCVFDLVAALFGSLSALF